MRVALYSLVGVFTLCAEGSAAPSDLVKRLQPEESSQPSLSQDERRRTVIKDMGEWMMNPDDVIADGWMAQGKFIMNLDNVFVDGWEAMDQFFTEDMVHWFETDFVDFWEDVGEAFSGAASTEWDTLNDFTDMTGDWFVGAWDTTVDGMSSAWEWTENAAITAWEFSEDLFWSLQCKVEDLVMPEDLVGQTCHKCVKDACNESLSEDLINQIDAANGIAIMDMNDEFDSMINGCTAALQKCPPVDVCNDLYNMSPASQKYVLPQLAQCNMCYQCLPFGSTRDTCKVALDQLMPNECADCSQAQLQMYQAFYSCSGIKEIYDSIEALGQSYEQGGTGYNSLNEVCKYCANCSGYKQELQEVCFDWAQIKNGWDRKPPSIPEELDLNGVLSTGSN